MADGLLAGSARIAILPDMSGFLAGLDAKLKAELAALDSRIPLKFDLDAASAAKAKAALGPLAAGQTIPLRFNIDQASVARARAALGPLAGQTVPVKFAVDQTSLARADVAARALAGDVGKVDVAAKGASAGFYGWWGALKAISGIHIPLFGGTFDKVLPNALSAASGIHLLTEAVIESVAVWAPATIAAAAFSAVAAPAADKVYTQMKNLYEISQATGQQIPPLTGGFSKLATAVQPKVYQLFGDALTLANHQTGAFSQLVGSTATVVDQLAARFVVAATSGKGFGSFLGNASHDLAGLGTSIGNVGGIIGNVLKAVPGYAEDLLSLGVGITHVAEVASGAAVPLLKVGLAAHGGFLYMGLAATAATKLVQGGLSKVASVALNAGAGLEKFGSTGEKAASGLLGIASGAEKAAALPWAWIFTAAAGVGVLAYALATAKDATTQWTSSMESSLNAAPAVKGLTMAQADQVAVTSRLAGAQAHYASVQDQVTKLTAIGGQALRGASAIYVAAHQPVSELASAQGVLSGQSKTYQTNLKALAQQFGGTAAAQGLLTAAGVTFGQISSKNKTTLAEVLAEVEGTSAAYTAMGQRGGILGEDMAVISRQASSQYTNMQKLDQSWSTYLGLTTSFGASVGSSVSALRQLESDAKKTGATFTGVNNASINLQNDFYSNLAPSLQTVVRGMVDAHAPVSKLAEVVSTELSPAVADGALKNDTMRTAIYNLAVEAGYTGSDKIRPLTAFLDQNKTSLQNATDAASKYGGALAKLPKAETVHIGVDASGKWSIQGASAYFQGSSAGHAVQGGKFAAGGRVPGAGIGDIVPALLEPGEAIVPRHLVPVFAEAFKAAKIPGFSGGGIVPSYTGNLAGLGPWVTSDYSATVSALEAATAKVAAGALSSAASTLGNLGAGVAASGPLQAYAKKLLAAYGWSNQWPAFDAVVNRESGWDATAQNRTSTAYGIGQFLNSTWGSVGGSKTSNPYLQLQYMMRYIKQAYPSGPDAAWASEVNRGYYDFGGVLPPGLTLASNLTGSGEFVLRGDQLSELTAGRGGDTYFQNYTTRANPSDIQAAFQAMEIRRATKERIGRPQ